MPLLQDLGFRVPLLIIFLVFPTLFFVLRRKWRISVARREEINRLLVLASEEAVRAEIEASFGFSSSISIPLQRRICAVCFAPTPNRCARCKSVHYCSGKCQIIHWRQGHKDECHPSLNIPENNDEEINFVGNTFEQFHFDEKIPTTESSEIKNDHVEIAPKKPDFTPSNVSKNNGNHSVPDPFLKTHLKIPDISDLSQSRESSSSDGTCIDDSISDVDSLHDLNTESCDSSSSERNEEQNRAMKVEPCSRVSFGGMKEKASSKATRSLDSNIIHSNKNLSKPAVPTSGFWDGSLDYCTSKKYKQTTDPKTDVGESGNLLSATHSKGLESSFHTYPGVSNTEKLISEPILTDKNPRELSRGKSSIIKVSKVGPTKVNVINNDKDSLKSEVGVTFKTLKDSDFFPSASKKEKANLDRSLKSTNGPTSGPKESNGTTVKLSKAGSRVLNTPNGLKTSVLKVVEQLSVPRLSKQSGDVGRNNEKAVFSYDLFVKLYYWKVDLRPCGLINCGNSCYANSILQCLAFTPPLTAYLLQGHHSKSCARKDWCFICEFERLILKGKESGSPHSPIGILSQIKKIGSHLSNGKEEDAHEFLRYAIDTMQTACLQDAGVNASSSLHEETTLMGLTFGGYLCSKIKCTKCQGKSEKQERMMDLTVEIGGDIDTLEEALRKFTGTEPLDGENKYHCARCKSYEKAKKKLTILEAPNILTIALKRFQSGKFGKLNKTIRFPEILNLAPYMRGGSDKSPIYRLYGVVVHLDIMNASFSGHYVCYVRDSRNKWYKIDDSTVKTVELENVLRKGAYMLFYSRISPRAPRSIRSTIISHDLPATTKIPDLDHSHTHTNRTSTSRHINHPSSHINRSPNDNISNLDYAHQNKTTFPQAHNIFEIDSSSDNSSLFSHSDEVSSSTTDSNRDSISADDISEYIFGYNAFFRQSSDSDTSSSSSSSSPEYTKQLGLMGRVPFLDSESSSKKVNISGSKSSREASYLVNGKSGVHLRRSRTGKTD